MQQEVQQKVEVLVVVLVPADLLVVLLPGEKENLIK